MTMSQLVRQSRAPRRQISAVLVIALVASIGLFVGTKLQPVSTTPPVPVPVYEAPPPVDHDLVQLPALLGRGGACFRMDARAALGPHPERYGVGVRRACETLAAGPQGMIAVLRAMDDATRDETVRMILEHNWNDATLIDAFFDAHPSLHPPLVYEAARYNLRRGNDARALAQLRAYLAWDNAHLSASDHYRGIVLAIEALEARQAQRVGGSNR